MILCQENMNKLFLKKLEKKFQVRIMGENIDKLINF